jgi:hypothetical protein
VGHSSRNSAFNWATGEPSIFAGDVNFKATRSGRTQAEASSAAGQQQKREVMKRTGVSPGYIPGLTRAERINSAPKAYARRSGVK